MEYGTCITDHHTKLLINKLERVQCHATFWVIEEYQRMARVTEMMAKLGWDALEVSRSNIRLAMFYNILNNLIAIQTTQLIIKANATRKKHASSCSKQCPLTTTIGSASAPSCCR